MMELIAAVVAMIALNTYYNGAAGVNLGVVEAPASVAVYGGSLLAAGLVALRRFFPGFAKSGITEKQIVDLITQLTTKSDAPADASAPVNVETPDGSKLPLAELNALEMALLAKKDLSALKKLLEIRNEILTGSLSNGSVGV